MNLLKYIARFNILAGHLTGQRLKSLTLGLGIVLSGAQTHAQSEKQISYPVAIPIERGSTSSTPAPTPAPAARDEVDKVQPAPQKKVVKKLAVEKPASKLVKTTVTKKSNTKPTSNTKKISVTKKPLAKNNNQKPAVKTVSVTKTKKIPSTTSAKVQSAQATPAVVLNKPVNAITQTELQRAAPLRAAIAPVAVASLAPAAGAQLPTGEEEAQLSASMEEEFTATADLPQQTNSAVATPSATATKNSALPMGTPHEGFVREFKNYVETRIVPRVPGVALAIIADGKVKVLQAYGVKKVGTRDFINTETAFRLASVSKSIAGTTAGVLVNDGIISWDTPVTSVLPNVQFSNPRYGNQLTLRNIMSQSSGLPTHAGDNYIEEGLPYDAVLGKLRAVNFVCPPGKCYTYQNVTMSLLADIVHKKTGKSYEQYVKEKLFMPLGMRNASIGLEGLLATKNYALPHELTGRGKWYTKEITQHYYRLNPAAGGNASITDMARWVLAQMGHNPDVLPSSTLQTVQAKTTKNTPAQSHYGAREGVTDTHYAMGWRTFDYRGDKNFLHHGGYVFGSRSEVVFNPELQIGMVILSNSNKLPGAVVFEFLDAYEDERRGKRTILPSKSKAAPKKPVVKKKLK